MMKHLIRVVVILAGCFAVVSARLQADERDDFFETKIRPVLAGTCYTCHGAAKTSGELRIDSRDSLLVGGESGPAIVPGRPEDSLLIRAIQRQDGVSAMPPELDKALRPDQVADFATWIEQGATWPAASAKFQAETPWALAPIQDPALPGVRDAAWVRSSVDAFIRARQEAAEVDPVAAADKLALIRRATFDLTGLPPTPSEVAAFVNDTSPRAFETVVNRLLESPAYGERWGRHWLDLVRYADTAGETADYPVPLAWRYRNYVIEAFRADKPYDEFLREQIAGDVLANQGPRERYAERVTATGYLAISRRFGFDSENYHHLTIQDTIDNVGQTVLGLSLGCARCHDHKFDAVSMRDYYGLYGIFDSSRYAFPGSEQKQKVRSLAPLIPPRESQPQWREYEQRVASLVRRLTEQQQPVPAAVLRSLSEIDGDFELQAVAAGGSNGVLVSPWLYEGKIAVTNAAQSPFKNLYALGKVGASVPADAGRYRIAQAIYPRRTSTSDERVYLNLDFRVAATDPAAQGVHRLALGEIGGVPAVEILISAQSITMRMGQRVQSLRALVPNQWHNLQLTLDLRERTISGRVGAPGDVNELAQLPAAADWTGAVDFVVFETDSSAPLTLPPIEYDNLGVQNVPIEPVSTEPIKSLTDDLGADRVALTEALQQATGIDGDFEGQTPDTPPATPWNPGPASVVQVSAAAQSSFQNIYPLGELGIRLPNRAEYDGFGLTLSNVKPNPEGRLVVGFDFRCASREAGGEGSWRYYLGHGPGSSAAVELFFNGQEFFRRSGDATEAVGPLLIGEWYQVQLTLDLNAKTYDGLLASRTATIPFSGQLATGWDGVIDYSFVDSYGHLAGVRPGLEFDNWVVSERPLPPITVPPVTNAATERSERRQRIAELRQQLAALQQAEQQARQELETLLIDGPFAMTYGMAEGAPHNVRMQLRGEPDQPGDEVPRGLIQSLGGGSLPADTVGSGRLELAQWLTRPDHPLTARVMVNRIWQYHFGRGLVKTPNDFGVRGLPPTHPELLDHLAVQFIRSGWSIKAMHRLMMLSATYQQASMTRSTTTSPSTSKSQPAATVADSSASATLDLTDLYVGFPRRRLSAEEIRDAMLAVSGELDLTTPQQHPFPSPISWGYSQHGPFNAVYEHNHRSIYLMTQRIRRHPFLALFDGADPNGTTAERRGTTVPTQALFFLNDPFVHAQAEQWANRLQSAGAEPSAQIELAYLQALGRVPSEDERAEAAEFLATYRAELAAEGLAAAPSRALAAYLRALLGSNEFLHVD